MAPRAQREVGLRVGDRRAGDHDVLRSALRRARARARAAASPHTTSPAARVLHSSTSTPGSPLPGVPGPGHWLPLPRAGGAAGGSRPIAPTCAACAPSTRAIRGCATSIPGTRRTTARSPRTATRAARPAIYNALRRVCRGCNVAAGDVLDWWNMRRWLLKYKRHLRGHPRLWSMHNYVDVNLFRPWRLSGTRRMLRLTRGRLWISETAGIVYYVREGRLGERHAAAATRWMLSLPRHSRRISRLYAYQWQAECRSRHLGLGLVPRQRRRATRLPRAGRRDRPRATPRRRSGQGAQPATLAGSAQHLPGRATTLTDRSRARESPRRSRSSCSRVVRVPTPT